MRDEYQPTMVDGRKSEIATIDLRSGGKNELRRTNYAVGLMIAVLFLTNVFGQSAGNENSADRVLRGSGRINASSLGMEFELPLGSYPGRGNDVPISLSYSSKVWRNQPSDPYEFIGPGANNTYCIPASEMKFAEGTASGWTSSMATPYIEYTGINTVYNHEGFPVSFADVHCPLSGGGSGFYPYKFIKRLVIHLPGGGSHEFRADDTVYSFAPGNSDPNSPYNAANWNTTFYAVDGSNLKYVQDSANGTYRLWLPDGSFYDFSGSTTHGADRIATKYTDSNGNYTSYYGSGSVDENNVTHPNGYWKDTLGRILPVPVGPVAPGLPTTAQNPQLYSLPGMSLPYKLQWKQLKGNSSAESGLLNFAENLRYYGNRRLYWGGSRTQEALNAPGTYLFSDNGEYNSLIRGGQEIFNPIVLTEIELPNGQKYEFKYDIYGRIVKIIYPTGGEEIFTYEVVPTLSKLELGADSGKANFGVTNRKVLKYAGDTAPYVWTYSAAYASTLTGYRITTNNPDGTKNERFMHRGNDPDVILGYGYDNPLAGMPYEERTFNDAGNIVSRKLTHWKFSALVNGWHPRVDHEESYIYDASGNGVYGTTKTEYEDEANLTIQSPILVKKVSLYAFVVTSGGGSITPGAVPAPTPIQTPTTPPTLLRTAESTFLINDLSITNRQSYKDRNMVELVTASVIKNGAGIAASRTETKYDESGHSPTDYVRGNPTTSRVWDNTKGDWDNPSAYISTRAKFDTYGNQYESIDAKSVTMYTEFDATHHAFPVKMTSAVPDPTNTHGSNTPFITTATFNPVTGLPLTKKDANGLETRFEYDPVLLRQLNTKTFYLENEVGGMSETIYHEESNNYWVKTRTLIDTGKWEESITYFDGLGRAYKTEKINSEGSIFVEKEFDQDGRIKRVTNPFRTGETKEWTTNVYDEASRIKEVITPDGAMVKTDYGVATVGSNVGTLITVTDQAGKMRRSITDALGRLTRVDEPNLAGQLGALDNPNQPTYYAYNVSGDLLTVNQGVQTRTFTYSSLSRLLSSTNPESGTIQYIYDNNGNVTKKTDGRNVETNYVYDALNRVTQRSYSNEPVGQNPTPTVTYFYDKLTNAKGKLIKVENGYSKTEYTEFDILGGVKKSKQSTDANIAEMEYVYNLSGALVEQKYPSGRIVRNVLDGNGELEAVQSKKNLNGMFWNYARNITYTTAGAVSSMELGNFLWESTHFNSRLQLVQIGLGKNKYAPNSTNPATDLLDLDYEYGELLSDGSVDTAKNNGNIAKHSINVLPVGSIPGFSAVQTYTYDSLNRVYDAKENIDGSPTPQWKQTFSYDRFGNRNFDETNTTADDLKFPKLCGTSQNPTMCAADRKVFNPEIQPGENRFKLDQDNDSTNDYLYDGAGNTTRTVTKTPTGNIQLRKFTYDGENKQTKVETVDANGNVTGTIGEYFYDGEGKRIKKIVPSTGEITIFVYDAANRLVAEYSTNVVAQQAAKVSYLTSDKLGSSRINTDQNGAVTARHDYKPFGEEIQRVNYGTDTIRNQFTSKERDKETNLDNFGARYYYSELGRFVIPDYIENTFVSVKPDPIPYFTASNPQSTNLYSYGYNNPLNIIDVKGHNPDKPVPGHNRYTYRADISNTNDSPNLHIKYRGTEIARVAIKGTVENPIFEWSVQGNLPNGVKNAIEKMIAQRMAKGQWLPRPPLQPPSGKVMGTGEEAPPKSSGGKTGRGGRGGRGGHTMSGLFGLGGAISLFTELYMQQSDGERLGYYYDFAGVVNIVDLDKAAKNLPKDQFYEFGGSRYKIEDDKFVEVGTGCVLEQKEDGTIMNVCTM